MKIGVFGGSFDPIHVGHLAFAQQIKNQIKLDKVLFVPTQNQYMKKPHEASFEDRCNMVEIAIRKIPGFSLEIVEKAGNTYTYDTLITIKQRYPNDELFFMAGADILETLPKWYKINKLGELCTFLIGSRDGSYKINKTTVIRDVVNKYSLKTIFVNLSIGVSCSSSYIREQLHERNFCYYLIPLIVLDYITDYNLYTIDT